MVNQIEDGECKIAVDVVVVVDVLLPTRLPESVINMPRYLFKANIGLGHFKDQIVFYT